MGMMVKKTNPLVLSVFTIWENRVMTELFEALKYIATINCIIQILFATYHLINTETRKKEYGSLFNLIHIYIFTPTKLESEVFE